VLVADTIEPNALLGLQNAGLVGLCLAGSAPLSHTVAVARHLGIPAVVGIGAALDELRGGALVEVDGDIGVVERGPRGARHPVVQQEAVPDLALFASLLHPDEGPAARAAGAAGVGLLRLEPGWPDGPPDEGTLTALFLRLVESMDGRPVAVRLHDGPRGTPTLGLRAVRRLLAAPKPSQDPVLRAAVRAARAGPLRLLLPLVTDPSEVIAVRRAVHDVLRELRGVGAPPALVPMVETPAAAMRAVEIAAVGDAVAVGVMDLAALVAGAAREEPRLHRLIGPDTGPVRTLLSGVARAARGAGVPSWVATPARPAGWLRILSDLGFDGVSLGLAELRRMAPRRPLAG
jgi:phosphotransferase system enzyme I (PtsI)